LPPPWEIWQAALYSMSALRGRLICPAGGCFGLISLLKMGGRRRVKQVRFISGKKSTDKKEQRKEKKEKKLSQRREGAKLLFDIFSLNKIMKNNHRE
jgi:hypothetical protein